MKTNSTFLGVGERGRTTAVMIQNVGHTLLASYRAQQPQQTPGSSVFRGTKQLQRSPVIETNSIFLSPTFLLPLLRIHRSISNEAFLNFPRIPTDRNYPFSPSNKTISLFLILCIELSIFISLLYLPFFLVPHFHTFSSILERRRRYFPAARIEKSNEHKLRINGVL